MTHSSEYDEQPQVASEVGADQINNARANLRVAADAIAPDGTVQRRKELGGCGSCVFFREPNTCRIVEGPVKKDLTCDWIQRRGGPDEDKAKERLPARSDAFAEPRSLAWGLMKMQEKLHLRVVDFQMTYEAPMLLVEDGQDPPHRFSISLDRFVNALSLENGWTPEEVDALVLLGKAMDFKPPVSYEEASMLYGRGDITEEEFQPFKRARKAALKAGG